MANLKVVLLRYGRTEKGWRRLRVNLLRKGRGWEEKIEAPNGQSILEMGEYQLRWYEGEQSRFRGVGSNLQDALIAREQQQAVLAAERAAAAVGRSLAPIVATNRIPLAQAREDFLEKKRLVDRDAETLSQYENLTTEFLRIVKKRFADELQEVDVLRFCDALRKRGCAERTVKNYYAAIATFLLACGIDHKTLVARENRPRKEDPLPVEYTAEEVKRFLAACSSERDRLVFETFLKTGCREQELAFLEWSDFNWSQSTITIRGEKSIQRLVDGVNREFRFRTKTRRSREITLEAPLVRKLREWKRKNPHTTFVFGTSSDLPNGHFLETVKRTAYRAGLNCGKCKPCRKKNECERWDLKTWRSTFATWALRGGVDIRTVQALMGHTKIDMTARYLTPLKGKAAQQRLNAVFAGMAR